MAQFRRSAHVGVGIAFVSTLLFSIMAHAKPGSGTDPYDAARDAEARLDYKAVIVSATAALAMPNSHDRLVTLYRLLGTASGVLGKTQDSVDAFTRLLAIDPEHRIPRGTSPKINGPFKEAGGYWVDRPGGLQVVPTLDREIIGGKALSIPVKIDDPIGMTASVRVNFRIAGEGEFKQLETTMGPAVTFSILPDHLPIRDNDYVLELYFVALSATGGELRLAGEQSRPLSIAVRSPNSTTKMLTTTSTGATVVTEPAKPKKPLIKQWWLWTAVGAVVLVGAGLGGGLGYYYGRPDTSHVDISLSSRVGP